MRQLLSLFNDHPSPGPGKALGLLGLLVLLNLAAWIWAGMAFGHFPTLLGLALLAYLFGLRHALDADHLAAIDNVVRKLSQKGGQPYASGFFFSLGHSTVVIMASALVALTAAGLSEHLRVWGISGGAVGTSISAFFLFFIAISNLAVLRSIWRAFIRARRGEPVAEADLDALLSGRGFFARLLRSLFDLVSESRHLYWVGFLFGLGFDTATEVGLLGLSATQAAQGLPAASLMVFPALFTAGMALVDTGDSVLMVQVYGWAFQSPLRKLWYNLTLTGFSILLALGVGSAEALGLLSDQMGWKGGFWDLLGWFGSSQGSFGLLVIALFIGVWAFAALGYRHWAQEKGVTYGEP